MGRLLENGVALVTGAGSGMGRAISLAFAAEGARVVCGDLNADTAVETAAMVKARGGDALGLKMDVTAESEVKAAVEAAVGGFGRLDYAVNNAGAIVRPCKLADLSQEGWDRTIAVNLTGVMLCMRHEIAQMRGQGSGVIINIASGAGVKASAGHAAYVASKHGVVGLTKAAMLDHCREGIRINAICPGGVDTPMAAELVPDQPNLGDFMLLGRMGRPEEIADAAVWLASDRSSFVYGATIAVDGGYTAM